MKYLFNTPWKIWNNIERLVIYPNARLLFALNNICWGKGWKFYGLPIIQKYRNSEMKFGVNLQLRSSTSSNPLGANHPVILCTWKEGAQLNIGNNFGMTGGSIIAAENIIIGDRVDVGANSTIIDTDFHLLDPIERNKFPSEAKTKPILIEDDVFIGMNCLILKGVTLGKGCVIGAGSIVTKNIPPGAVAAGNPAKVIRILND